MVSPPRVGFVITIATARQWPVDDGHGRPGRVPLHPSGMISASDSPIGLPLIGCRIQGGLHSRRHRVAPVGWNKSIDAENAVYVLSSLAVPLFTASSTR